MAVLAPQVQWGGVRARETRGLLACQRGLQMTNRVSRASRRASAMPAVQAFGHGFTLKASRGALMLGTALGCSIAVFTTFTPTPVLAADVTCAPDASGSTTSGPEFCQNLGDKITYTANGDLTVVRDNVGTNTGGVQIDASGGKYNVTVYDLFKAGFLYNNAGAGLKVVSADGNISIDTTTGGANTTGSGTFVLGSTFGIDAENADPGGTGKIDITQGAYVSSKGTGVYAHTYNGAINITSVGGNAGGPGLYAHSTSGPLSVHLTSGTISGAFYTTGTGAGIKTVQNSGGGTHAFVDAGATVDGGNGTAGNNAINVLSGLGSAVVGMYGTVSGGGIVARSNGANIHAAATVGLRGDVTNTDGDGVFVRAAAGEASFDQVSGAISAGGRGVFIQDSSTADLVAVSAQASSITSAGTGLYALATGKGGIQTNMAGNITSNGGAGIVARAAGGDINMISSGVIKVAYQGIVATNSGAGGVKEHIYSNVYGGSGAIRADVQSGAIDLRIEPGVLQLCL